MLKAKFISALIFCLMFFCNFAVTSAECNQNYCDEDYYDDDDDDDYYDDYYCDGGYCDAEYYDDESYDDDNVDYGNLDQEKVGWELLNQLRLKYGLAPVAWNPDSNLQAAARVRAQEISRLFSHDRPDGSSCFTAIKQAGIRYRTCGENIAMGTNLDAERSMELWTDSPGHFKNMTDGRFTQVGIAAFRAGDNVYWVQLYVG